MLTINEPVVTGDLELLTGSEYVDGLHQRYASSSQVQVLVDSPSMVYTAVFFGLRRRSKSLPQDLVITRFPGYELVLGYLEALPGYRKVVVK